MVKIPAFQFYPADWLNDIKLQTCSLAAQGLLLNLMCLMHQSEKYGYLLINGFIPSAKDVAHLLRLHHKTYQAGLKELILKGVLCKDEKGIIHSKRMVKDEYIRQVRREAGKLGGNPLLKQTVKQDLKQKTTPSSSTSPSSSKHIKYPSWLDLPLWKEFKKYRTKIKAPLTDHAEKLCLADLKKVIDEGHKQKDVVNQTIMSGKWKSFYPVKNKKSFAERPSPYNFPECGSCGARASSIKKGKECSFCGGIA